MEFKEVISLLEEVGQNEIISKLKEVSKEEQKEFVNQINELDKFCRGYKRLHQKSKNFTRKQCKENEFIS